MKTKKVTISLTQEQQDKAKKDSIEVFGNENFSGYIQILIQNGFAKKSKSVGKKLNKKDLLNTNLATKRAIAHNGRVYGK